MIADIPARGTITARPHAKTRQGLQAAHKHLPLGFPICLRRILMRVAMMRDLMPGGKHLLTGVGEGICCVPRDTPGCFDLVLCKQFQQPLGSNLSPKLAAREIFGREHMKGAIPEGKRIKVHTQPDRNRLSGREMNSPGYLLISHCRSLSLQMFPLPGFWYSITRLRRQARRRGY